MEALSNRIRKNEARLTAWARREQVTAYRLYDREIPEFPYSVDRYGDDVLVSEFVSPRARRQSEADRQREHEAVASAVQHALGVDPNRLHFKSRERHLSLERQTSGNPRHERVVLEHGLSFHVNLVDYLDTGLFLDHRPARRRLGKLARGRSLLNLFCYTGAFTVHAAAQGAASTTSVDLSTTYLAWAQRNLEANGLQGPAHQWVRDDVFHFLETDRQAYDLIVLDPPTVSRSSAGRSFEVQGAWARLVTLCLERLTSDGLLFFSTNDRRFQFDPAQLPACRWSEVTDRTTPAEFRDRPHRSFELRRPAP